MVIVGIVGVIVSGFGAGFAIAHGDLLLATVLIFAMFLYCLGILIWYSNEN